MLDTAPTGPPLQRDRMLIRFLFAAVDGDVASLELMLAEDAVLYGGEAIVGAAQIADFMARDPSVAFDVDVTSVDGRVQAVYLGRQP
jgi:hypothetical protein